MICYISTSKDITFYWEKYECFEDGYSYRIIFDDKELGRTEKTHYTVRNLLENKKYIFLLELVGKDGELILSESVQCQTKSCSEKIDITKPPYCAVGDGKTLNTEKIQAAIDDCKEGECVYIPAGDFLTGALKLHSNMELYLEKDALLHGTTNVEDYLPKIPSRFEGIEMMCYSSLINMGNLDSESDYNCKNVMIYGEGTICGGGKKLSQNIIETESILMKDYIDTLGEKILDFEKSYTIPGRTRPRLINISNSQNIVIYGITIENGPCWNVHMIYSDNIITHNCVFRSEGVWNGDGWNPDSSTNCTIFNCDFYTGDDSVAVKSGKNPQGNIINRPSKYIKIFDCRCLAGHGITIGSEMAGGVEDVHIWDCDLANTFFGVEIKATKKRGGYVRKVQVNDTKVSRILMHNVPYNDDGEAAADIPVFEDCIFRNLHLYGEAHMNGKTEDCDVIELVGFDEPGHCIKNIKFKKIILESNDKKRKQNISLACCEGISIEDIYCSDKIKI